MGFHSVSSNAVEKVDEEFFKDSEAQGRTPYMSRDEMETVVLEHREHGARLAWSFLKEWRIRLPADEVISVVGAALCQAAYNFDPSRGVAFKTFLYYHLRGMLIKEITQMLQDRKMYEAAVEDPSASAATIDQLTHSVWPFRLVESNTPEKSYEKNEVSNICWTACAQLDPLEQEIVIRQFVNDETLIDIAKDLEYCRCHISRVKSRAIKKMREFLGAKEFSSPELGEVMLKQERAKRKDYSGGRGRRKANREKSDLQALYSLLKRVA